MNVLEVLWVSCDSGPQSIPEGSLAALRSGAALFPV